LLKVENIDVYYSKVKVLNNVCIDIDDREIVTIIGANGAGKTTLLRTLSGLLHPQKGRITYLGDDISKAKPEIIAEKGISHIPQGKQIFGPLKVVDNLILGAYLRFKKGTSKDEIDKDMEFVFSMFPVLKERQNQLGGTLSGGEQQMLAIGRALMAKPSLLLLDEPSMGLSPIVTKDILKNLMRLNKDHGITLFLVEQNASIALTFAERTYVLNTGEITVEGKSKDLLKDERIKQAYLGVIK
jgi:branched-chain amino acid transport system ATP-binding protein